MLRAVVLLLVVAVLLVALWSLMRGARRRDMDRPPAAKRLLPAPAPKPLPPAPQGALESQDVLRRFYELAFGASLELPAADWHEEVTSAAHAALDAQVTDPRYAPRRPMLLPELMRAINDHETSRRELARIILRDPAVAGSLLKLANSSLYRVSPRPVESIERAVALLGTEGIRSLVAAALLQPVFRLKGARFAQFPDLAWEHTLRSAAAAEMHAAAEKTDPFAAQLLALIAGLGVIIVFRAALDQYQTRPHLTPHAPTIAALIEARAGDVARRVAQSWGLSERTRAALDGAGAAARTADESVALARSLRFGWLIGALSILVAHGRIEAAGAHATLLAAGITPERIARIWPRLSGAGIVSSSAGNRP